MAAARFRPNLVLEAPADPPPGAELRLGDVVLRVLVPTPRCVVPGLERGAPTDRDLLAVLARDYRTDRWASAVGGGEEDGVTSE